MSTAVSTALPTADELRSRVRDALVSVGATVELGSPNDGGLPASTAITPASSPISGSRGESCAAFSICACASINLFWRRESVAESVMSKPPSSRKRS